MLSITARASSDILARGGCLVIGNGQFCLNNGWKLIFGYRRYKRLMRQRFRGLCAVADQLQVTSGQRTDGQIQLAGQGVDTINKIIFLRSINMVEHVK
jgi:hypothetical protein